VKISLSIVLSYENMVELSINRIILIIISVVMIVLSIVDIADGDSTVFYIVHILVVLTGVIGLLTGLLMKYKLLDMFILLATIVFIYEVIIIIVYLAAYNWNADALKYDIIFAILSLIGLMFAGVAHRETIII